MAEYIERRALWKKIALIQERRERDGQLLLAKALEIVLRIVENVPAADVAPVVRCKDCRHSRNDGSVCVRKVSKGGARAADKVYPGFFCAAGERKDGDGNG